MRSNYLYLFILLTCTTGSFAQLLPDLGGQRVGTAAFSFLKLSSSARQTAMGGTGVASAGDVFAVNAACMSEVKETAFGVSGTLYHAGIRDQHATIIFPAKKYSTFGFTLQSLNTGAMEKRTEFQPDGTGELFYAGGLAIGGSYARVLSDFFSYGVKMSYVQESLAEYKVHSGVIDLGFLYKTGYKDLRFAVLLDNFGVNTRMRISGQQGELEPAERNTDHFTVPTVFKMGLAMTPLKKALHSLTFAAELHHPNDQAEHICLGAEYAYTDLLFIRSGYRIGIPGQYFPSFGIGLRMRMGKHPLYMDYGAEPAGSLGLMQQLSLRFSFNTKSRKEEGA